MARKTHAQRKDALAGTKSAKAQASRRSNRAVAKEDDDGNQEAERSRRSSTAAQTAASVAESRVTRSRITTKKEAPSVFEDSSKESQSSRARSARRTARNVNYKESDGEEEAPTPKNEEEFESNEEFDDSDSDEKNKKKTKKGRSAPKGRTAKPKGRAAAKGGRRARATRKKKESDDEDKEEEEEMVELSDSSIQEKEPPVDDAQKKDDDSSAVKEEKTTSSSSGRRKSKPASTPIVDLEETPEKSGRRSRRASAKSLPSAAEPVSKRPSRNTQVKKYTEVDDEDFFEGKSEEEGEFESDAKKESGIRKRKRESESEPNKRPRIEKPVIDIEDEDIKEEKGVKEKEEKPATTEQSKAEDDVFDDPSSDEPMEIDESVPDETPPEKDDDQKDLAMDEVVVEKKAEKDVEVSSEDKKQSRNEEPQSSAVTPLKEPVVQEVLKSKECDEKPKEIPAEEKNDANVVKDKQTTEPSKPSVEKADHKNEEVTCPKADKPSAESELKATPVVPAEQDKEKAEPKPEVSTSQSHDNTFPPKEQPPTASVNGEEGERRAVETVPQKETTPSSLPSTEPVFQHQNDTAAPKTNGAPDELDGNTNRTLAKDSLFILPNRKYVFNRYIGEDLRSSLKEGTFAIVSYNLSSGVVNNEKLVHELDKLQASIICLQEVSRSFFNETLESKLDVLGYKAVANSPWSDSGLVTFYKSSQFRACNVKDISTQNLISQALEKSSLEESEKQAVSGCFDKCGNVLITQLMSVLGSHAVTVANVKIPPCSMSLNALQVSCVTRKISTLREHIKPVLICGEFNISENEVPYQLMKNGYLSERMVEELKSRTDGSECAALIKLLQSVSDSPSCAMSSCYNLVLGKELELSRSKGVSPDLVWASSDNLHIIGVLDASTETEEVQKEHRISLKADVAFFV